MERLSPSRAQGRGAVPGASGIDAATRPGRQAARVSPDFKEHFREQRFNEELWRTNLSDSVIVGNAQEKLDFLTNILQASTEYSIIGKGLDGTILLWNEGARRLYGYESCEVVGRANASILHVAEDLESGLATEIMAAALRDGKWEGTLKRRRKNGEHFNTRVVITPRRDTFGRAVGLLISKDISGEMKLTEELQASREELNRSNLRLKALFEMSQQLTSEHDPEQLVKRYCDTACRIVGARYGMVAIMHEHGDRLLHFNTQGFDTGQSEAMEPSPPFKGAVAKALTHLRSVRISGPCDPEALGVHPSFPPLQSVLVTPVASHKQVYGWLWGMPVRS
jgi:PAS domain S-box-containing protein